MNSVTKLVPKTPASQVHENVGRPGLVRAVEHLLWRTRLLVIVAVVASLLTSAAMLFVSSVDLVHLARDVLSYSDPRGPSEHEDIRSAVVVHVVQLIDGYLLSTVLLIFAFGLYEVFIHKLHDDATQEASRILVIHGIDDLKDRLAKLVLLILVVKFFEHALSMEFATPLHLVYLAVGVVLIAAALHLSHAGHRTRHRSVSQQ
jgi:uncharacterized membrane protein YqhA